LNRRLPEFDGSLNVLMKFVRKKRALVGGGRNTGDGHYEAKYL
jgi:hypothetical protein